jgi:glycine/D-amino acid oxidase-like deaminating enzyme
MSEWTAKVVICGAGIAGIAVAYELAVRRDLRDILLIEAGDPLALTSDKSTEAYRVWWPDAAMVALMGRSIDMIEALAHETDNAILLNRRGYLYVTSDATTLQRFQADAERIAALGAGPLRIHPPGGGASPYQPAPAHGFTGQPEGADLILDPALIRAHFPYLSPHSVALLHVRRAGWFSGRQLGMYLLEQARAHGVRLLRGRLTGVELSGEGVGAVHVTTAAETVRVATTTLISAAGPLQQEVGRLLGIELPLYHERHLKASINDPLGLIPRHAPMVIAADPITLPWDADERAVLGADPELCWLLDPLPSGAHTRPEGGAGATTLLLLWDYHTERVQPQFPITPDPQLTELALRALATAIPALKTYVERTPQAYIDGGYYTRTRENRPLIGPLPVAGAFIIGGLSGYGLMASCGAAELLAAHVLGDALPPHAAAYMLSRYDDPAYQEALAHMTSDGQL